MNSNTSYKLGVSGGGLVLNLEFASVDILQQMCVLMRQMPGSPLALFPHVVFRVGAVSCGSGPAV